ncbi:Peptidase M23 [Wenzhouxiangella marina]|uniref:Peptidase M23 n=2 Tax=Wenzhouxiangella marina TaxID=1579979 RepID=A0A0K0XSH1_9GAMM|nr:Peptidase M23 [Wenzhouxiangella marina]
MARPRRRPAGQTTMARFEQLLDATRPPVQGLMRALRAHPGWSASAGALILVAGLLGLIGGDESGADATIHASALTLPPQPTSIGSASDAPAAEPSMPLPIPVGDLPPAREWTLVEVRPGQTLDRIFRELSLGPSLLHSIVNLDEHTAGLANIRPGDQFAFDLDAEGELRALRAELDEQRWLYIEREEDELISRIEDRELERRVVEASGLITSSLFNAAKDAGLSDNMTMRLAAIFGWDIDFALDIRSGDRFALVYEQVYRDGEFLRDGDILAARFVNQGEPFEAIRFDAGDGPDYFAPDGRPMRKAFLRAPLNFSYVTSNFNPRRFHPVTRRVSPHNGTDYGAPVGTPVWAAGDGRVIESAYNNINGHYVFIQHGNNIVTKYLHLSRRQVSRGDRVRQGQTIGRVGATGRVTGAHLHYEFLLNGVHRNPRTVDLPPANPLPDELMERFQAYGDGLLAQLQLLDAAAQVQLAQQNGAGCQATQC